jgi:hypothetical protein
MWVNLEGTTVGELGTATKGALSLDDAVLTRKD